MADGHCHECSAASLSNPSVHQSLDEMEFERGIWKAALDGDIPRINILLKKGIAVDSRDSSGYTALHYAARQGDHNVTQLLLNHNADVNAATKAGGLTPLHRAAHQGHAKIVNMLLRARAQTETCDADGKTALHKAAENNHYEVCKMLLEHSPKLAAIEDNRGSKPEDIARDESLRKMLASKR